MNTKSPLQIQAYEYLKEQILSGKLDPDVLYSETRMSAEIGISRTPMREAIQCLSQDGYIHVVPSKGFMIRQLTQEDMAETIQVRCAIEGFCVHLIAAEPDSRKGQRLQKELEQLLERQTKALQNQNEKVAHKQFMESDHQFHLTIVRYAQNREFEQMFQRLMYLIRLTTKSALEVPGRAVDTLHEHELFFECLKRGDGDAAYHHMVNHLKMPLTLPIAKTDRNNNP